MLDSSVKTRMALIDVCVNVHPDVNVNKATFFGRFAVGLNKVNHGAAKVRAINVV